ncbi:hypothetical protein ES703_41538 [subsurface metagenome]
MSTATKYLWIMVLALAVVAFALGTVFIVQGVEKSNWMKEAIRLEKVTIGIDESAAAKGDVVDSLNEAQHAGDTIREHRRAIAPTYEDLLAGERFDPTITEHLTYAQAMNLENYLYVAVLGFGVTQMLIGSGVFMLVMGIALGVIGLALRRRAS